MAAWNATYRAYKQDWFNAEFTKQNAMTFCTLQSNKRFIELTCKLAKHKKFDYGLDHMKVLQLDYINNANFDFK